MMVQRSCVSTLGDAEGHESHCRCNMAIGWAPGVVSMEPIPREGAAGLPGVWWLPFPRPKDKSSPLLSVTLLGRFDRLVRMTEHQQPCFTIDLISQTANQCSPDTTLTTYAHRRPCPTNPHQSVHRTTANMEYRTPKDDNAPAVQRFGKWLRLKQYQIEVTFGVYMFTPVEKSVFCT